MNQTKRLHAPVISILSPSFTASKKAISLISALGNLEQFCVVTDDIPVSPEKTLNETFKSSIPKLSRSWHSVGSRCPVSGSIIHFCSVGDDLNVPEANREQNRRPKSFALLGITDIDDSDLNDGSKVDVAIRKFRELLASRLNEAPAVNRTILNLKCILNGNVTAKDLLKDVSHDGLPLLSPPKGLTVARSSVSLRKDLDERKDQLPFTFLKEIVVPHFDYAEYCDGSTLLSNLSLARTNRPAIGVFEWPNSSTCIRPLPTASEDRNLPSPSLIFHCESPEDTTKIKDFGFHEARIGYNGLGHGHGQVMLLHKDLMGLDVRYCPRTTVSSAFSEAQDSLLAGSLEELQSTNVLVSSSDEARSDMRIGNGDCWVEVRANLKRPGTLWQRSKTSSRKQRIAKIPDIPYE